MKEHGFPEREAFLLPVGNVVAGTRRNSITLYGTENCISFFTKRMINVDIHRIPHSFLTYTHTKTRIILILWITQWTMWITWCG